MTKIGLKKYKKICRLPLDLALLYALEGEKIPLVLVSSPFGCWLFFVHFFIALLEVRVAAPWIWTRRENFAIVAQLD